MRHIISCLVENHPGVLAKVAGLFSTRGFNIDSLNVGTTVDPTVSRMTIVTGGDDAVVLQITRQLEKVIDVIEVVDVTEDEHVERELVLIKVQCDSDNRRDVIEIAEIFDANLVDVSPRSIVLEIVGDAVKIRSLFDLLDTHNILQVDRTGPIALPRSASKIPLSEYGVRKSQTLVGKDQI